MCVCLCVCQPQQITVQGQQAQTAEGQTILYQPVNADGTVLQQGNIATSFLNKTHKCVNPWFCYHIKMDIQIWTDAINKQDSFPAKLVHQHCNGRCD